MMELLLALYPIIEIAQSASDVCRLRQCPHDAVASTDLKATSWSNWHQIDLTHPVHAVLQWAGRGVGGGQKGSQ
jgi:hypothetical protein